MKLKCVSHPFLIRRLRPLFIQCATAIPLLTLSICAEITSYKRHLKSVVVFNYHLLYVFS